jgi:hypothetical protein
MSASFKLVMACTLAMSPTPAAVSSELIVCAVEGKNQVK